MEGPNAQAARGAVSDSAIITSSARSAWTAAPALLAGIEEVFGTEQPVQRCRNHKMWNVVDELPREQRRPSAECDARRLEAARRRGRHEAGGGLARFLEHKYESAARSLREGRAEMFTIQKPKLPPSLYKCLGTTNGIEAAERGPERTRNVTRWRDAEMVER